eukprot:4712997-Pleurochrysis_carterae.AAC.1
MTSRRGQKRGARSRAQALSEGVVQVGIGDELVLQKRQKGTWLSRKGHAPLFLRVRGGCAFCFGRGRGRHGGRRASGRGGRKKARERPPSGDLRLRLRRQRQRQRLRLRLSAAPAGAASAMTPNWCSSAATSD